MKRKRYGRKALSHRHGSERFHLRLSTDAAQWLKEKAKREDKSLSVVLTELIRSEMRKELEHHDALTIASEKTSI